MAAPQPIRSQSYERVYALIQASITNRQPLAAVYKHCRRLFCPYVLGRNGDGKLRVLCYQYGGESASGLKRRGSQDNWRCIDLEQLSEVELLNDKWVKPPNYSPHQTCIKDVEFAVTDEK